MNLMFLSLQKVIPIVNFLQQHLLEAAEKIYSGTPSLLVAMVHQALAKSLLVNHNFEGNRYCEHAQKAWKMAMDVVPGTHPSLALFRFTLGNCQKGQLTV